MFIYGRKSINGCVEWLGVPALSCGTGVDWPEKSLFPILVGETYVSMNVEL